ncbi:MAG: roadblock/LC7 domain-containing protein [Desulfobacteraceae bacterium]|nr:roadblock/LC7 domain-containing protein [Desulfobacteraceae bacterium]
MTLIEKFSQISRIEGVDQYVLVDQIGNIVAHKIDDPQKVAKIVFNLGKNFYSLGKTQFKHVTFSRENQKNFFIFPVGNHCLGVIKQKNINNITLTDNIVNFLNSLLKE